LVIKVVKIIVLICPIECFARIFLTHRGRNAGADWMPEIDKTKLAEIDEQVAFE